ncbi:MAG: bifunctional (p)ppGpp synthetase/guanosine-3',5'-bis(diphosphate) 3'-pyrophosphohydrolase [Eubacteriales bacterium]|nr:bifunctional (p)ppGpp synthetase/guanosine-3',5'-bis(diphosphate) 3'-pyrophosphohydrolase [Eubacterium sp.]MDD7180304.1 bifunctional (p)ppGpp synthetase/guanosine-3',5'-bis(diphosphate) 3'-pyrophosphohydrolase [Eubacterium sp.]MDY5492972.1 bifunctional (p)ppGpp synthetase/guanosine-3',5'-bis(diphosphate) 3'-pyrophosphohydrolase [Eubacteriales bacterium]
MFSGIDRLLFILENTGKKYNIEKITKAYEYAKQLHEGQYRKSGEEYICHPVAVAEIVAGLELDTDSICAALLHDTLEDCADKIDIEKIKKEFGPQVAELVDGLTKLVQIRIEDKEDAHMESLRKMFLAMAKDVRVIFIKLADRLHNMRTLDAQPENKRRTIALETMHVYAPLAHRLGMQRIKQELENLALSYLDPIGYEEVSADIERKFGENRDFINKTRKLIHEKMNENGIKCTLEGRVKSVYSIYKKMYNQNKSFDEIYDFYAIRIIVNTELECYTALGIIHEMFNSMPGRFKDYISIPKPNMYRSLHTTVIGRDGIPFEVQIRTWEMHQIAEYGIAAHWKYKSGDKGDGDLDRKLEWIAKLIENESSTADPDEFIDALKIDIFQDETFVFTPKGDVITLPQNANCIDFAYHIHSAVGNRMIGAKVNGMIVPIDRKLNNGEIVEIITSSASKGPSRDWLKVACTSEARAKIRQWFKKEKRAENIEAGKNEIQTELRRISPVHVTDEQFNEITGKVASRLGMNSPEDLFGMLGYGGISMTTVGSRLKEEFERVVMPEPEVKITDVTQVQTVQRPRSSHSYGGVIVDGVEGCQVKFAKCCNPLPGDNIVGFITKGYGISVHKVDCPNVLNSISKENDRFVNVEWKEVDETDSKHAQYEALMQVITEDRISMLADISTTLADMKVSIIQINTQKRAGGEIVFNIAVACKNLAHFNSIMARLKSIKDVVAVERGYAKNGG